MRVFKIKAFEKFARLKRISDKQLCKAVEELREGHFNADLGGGVFKQRVARSGGGKSGGFRMILLFKIAGSAFFVFGFAKSELTNITPKALKAFKRLAEEMFALEDSQLDAAVSEGELTEVNCNEQGSRS